MSRFLSARFADLEAYVPGEQPQDRRYVKLNTNESPFPPAPAVLEAVNAGETALLNRYPDPEGRRLKEKLAGMYGVGPEHIFLANGSDELLSFAFLAFCDQERPVAFPSISYGFYPVYANLYQVPCQEIPLREGFLLDFRDYCGLGKNIVIANPNAPTGRAIPVDQIEEIVRTNPDNIVIIDEAYIDFGGESALTLLPKYENLLVTRTFSKSRSLAGARLGFGMGSEALIGDLKTMKDSTNPYNVNRMTAAAGVAAMEENDYYMDKVRTIRAIRDDTAAKLRDMGCLVTDSHTNFLFVEVPGLPGAKLYELLREQGILVRQWNRPRIENRCRVTVGTQEEMDAFVKALEEIK